MKPAQTRKLATSKPFAWFQITLLFIKRKIGTKQSSTVLNSYIVDIIYIFFDRTKTQFRRQREPGAAVAGGSSNSFPKRSTFCCRKKRVIGPTTKGRFFRLHNKKIQKKKSGIKTKSYASPALPKTGRHCIRIGRRINIVCERDFGKADVSKKTISNIVVVAGKELS